MKKLGMLLATSALVAFAAPAHASLMISISDGVHTFHCVDGAACDLDGGQVSNLLTLNNNVGAFHISGTLSASQKNGVDDLNTSSFSIKNNGTANATITIVVSDTGFSSPVHEIVMSGSGTFNRDFPDVHQTTEKFWADPNNVQGANPLNTPGSLLDTIFTTPASNPDSFSGTVFKPFDASNPFSMTEAAAINLNAGGSLTGFNLDMQASPVPLPGALMLFGTGLAGLCVLAKKKRHAPMAMD